MCYTENLISAQYYQTQILNIANSIKSIIFMNFVFLLILTYNTMNTIRNYNVCISLLFTTIPKNTAGIKCELMIMTVIIINYFLEENSWMIEAHFRICCYFFCLPIICIQETTTIITQPYLRYHCWKLNQEKLKQQFLMLINRK